MGNSCICKFHLENGLKDSDEIERVLFDMQKYSTVLKDLYFSPKNYVKLNKQFLYIYFLS